MLQLVGLSAQTAALLLELLLLALLGAFTGVLAGGCAVIFRYIPPTVR